MSECLKCGNCCRNIFISDTLFDSDNPVDKACALFIMENWEVIETYRDVKVPLYKWGKGPIHSY